MLSNTYETCRTTKHKLSFRCHMHTPLNYVLSKMVMVFLPLSTASPAPCQSETTTHGLFTKHIGASSDFNHPNLNFNLKGLQLAQKK